MNDRQLEKPLPSAEEGEHAILGAILLDNDVMSTAVERLKPEDFYSPRNRRIFSAMMTLFGKSKPIDPILIGEEMKAAGDSLDAIGGVSAINQLAFGLPQLLNVEDYIKAVWQKSRIRNIIRTANGIVSYALAEEEDFETTVNKIEAEMFGVCENPEASKAKRLSELVAASLKRTADRIASGAEVVGLPSGLKDLDEVTGGWRNGNLIILGGRPSMGKSAAGIQWALNGASSDGESVVAYFTLEDTDEAGADRIIAQQGRLDLRNYRQARVLPVAMERAHDVLRQVEHREFYIIDDPAITPMQLLAKCRRLKAEKKRLDLVVIDYLQLMTASRRSASRQEEVSQITRELKLIARELDCPVIALSQLSREVEKRVDKRPIMSDLRESGSIEQDADVIVFVFREEYYNATEENRGLAEFIIAKHKNGPTHAGVKVAFLKEYVRFENYFDGTDEQQQSF